MAVVTARMVQEDVGVDPTRIFSKDIKVPTRLVGLIIGRKGERIQRMQCETGCRIQIARDNDCLPDRLCTLTGNAWSIGKAETLIDEFVRSRSHIDDLRSRPPTTPSSSTNVQSSEITSSAPPTILQSSVCERSNPELKSPDDSKIVQTNFQPPPSVPTNMQSYFEVTLVDSADAPMDCELPSSVPATVQAFALTSINSTNEETNYNTAPSDSTEEQLSYDFAETGTSTRTEAEDLSNEVVQSESHLQEVCSHPDVPISESTTNDAANEQSCKITPNGPATNVPNVQLTEGDSANEQNCEITLSDPLTNVHSSISTSIVPTRVHDDSDVKEESMPSTRGNSCASVQIEAECKCENSEFESREPTAVHQTANALASNDSKNVPTSSELTLDLSSNVNKDSVSSKRAPTNSEAEPREPTAVHQTANALTSNDPTIVPTSSKSTLDHSSNVNKDAPKNSEAEPREPTANALTSNDSTNMPTSSELTLDRSSNVNKDTVSAARAPTNVQLHDEPTSADPVQIDSESTSSDSTNEQTNSESTPSNSSRGSKATKKCSVQ